ncbi:tyrosine-type recombinase/integrase [Bythopirellula goksoeyrii]|uniref:Tyrosine recombinase XerC n=1 Tax=Bythopirellula goksoeyrii TaxID=1400387 RepID=A0A5B9QPY5_9BACT|nr:site-specific integrase [Bythopirellula goksoeyrii]QEG36191.1 Tyrosine recombinase XerC [Bythopirellula goksoeyrii]
MSKKFPKPWYRPARGVWYVTIDGHQFNLGPDEDAAFEQYYHLMSSPPELRQAGDTVAGIIDAFLEWCQIHRSHATYEWYRSRAQLFVDSISNRLTVEQLKPFHLQRWIDSNPQWAPGNKRNACRAIQRPLAWAVQQGYIDKSPLQYFQKPPAGRRDQTVSFDEFRRLLRNTRDRSFRDLLLVTWETGARPQETLRVEARHVDLHHSRWVFPANEAKGGRLPRIIYLNTRALRITKRWLDRNESGPIFRNTRNKPWTKCSVNSRFFTLKRLLGTRYSLYSLRHTWATNALKNGVDPITVSQLMGHADTNMLARTYAHLAHDPAYLQAAAQRATV